MPGKGKSFFTYQGRKPAAVKASDRTQILLYPLHFFTENSLLFPVESLPKSKPGNSTRIILTLLPEIPLIDFEFGDRPEEIIVKKRDTFVLERRKRRWMKILGPFSTSKLTFRII
jgi:hypothetical protein